MRQDGRRPGAGIVVLRAVVATALLIYTLLDELLFPLFRPLIRWLGGLRVFERIGWLIGQAPPYFVLVLLAVPLAVIEPAKVYALFLIATGHVVLGIGALIAAQIASLLICERIYHAGRTPLLRIGWFRALMGWIVGLRDGALALLRSTGLWQAASRLARRVRTRVRGLFRQLVRRSRP